MTWEQIEQVVEELRDDLLWAQVNEWDYAG